MSIPLRITLLSRRLLAAASGVMLCGGCGAPARATLAGSGVASAGIMMPGIVATPYLESPTVSFALDRIDQHALPLDHTYRHYGSGRGVTVYVFDGGVLAVHPELAGRVRAGFDAFPDETRLCNAHGTAVAGAVAGTTLGVAPETEIVDVKMVECRQMRGTIDAIIEGTAWVLADHARHPDRRAVANWSFIADTSATVPALDSAVARLLAAGIPVVVSAGNVEQNACHISPANSPGAIVVGASRVRRSRDSAGALLDARVPGTAYGACLNVFAPGDSVLLPSFTEGAAPTSQLWSGTSMAAGYVSGAIALFLQAHPFASVQAVAAHISSTSTAAGVDALSPHAGMLYVGAPKPRPTTIVARR